MISPTIARVNAGVLLAAGAALLFAADDVMRTLAPGFASADAWVGQLLGVALIALAAMNWFSKDTLLGGIYGRGIVVPNMTLYFMAASTLLRPARASGAPGALRAVFGVAIVGAIVYGWLMFRGPIASDFAEYRGSAGSS